MSSDMKIDSHSIVNCALSIEWKSEHASHQDVRVFEKFNVWRDLDIMPFAMQQDLMGKSIGHQNRYVFKKSDLMEPWQKSLFHRVRVDQFKTRMKHGYVIEPHIGRFYPRGLVEGVPDNYSDNMHPCRLVEMTADHLCFDFNHPMVLKDEAWHEVTLGIAVYDIKHNTGEHGGRCSDVVAELLTGPGMQARYPGVVTDFFSAAKAFSRPDEAADGLFYALPRRVEHLDRTALQQVTELYNRLIPQNVSILDLMASGNSHLPDRLHDCQVTGLGLNQQELDANSVLNSRVIHDLNAECRLPFEDAAFDAVICTVSVEYLVKPFDVFREVARVLRPGGLFINVFSNRWFPPKAISVWCELHEFERMGLVSEYYLQSGHFIDIHTYSMRGLSRPEDDAHILQTPDSDPVYAVWGMKK